MARHFTLCSVFAASALQALAVDYTREIKPLLQERCYACHGALKQKGGLRLDTVAAMKTGGDNGDATKLILERIAGASRDEQMPPEGEGSLFSSAQIEKIRTWIAEGAKGVSAEQPEADPRDHWAYQSPKSSGRSIDELHRAYLQEKKLVPQKPASHEVWLRRVAFDITGLPPSASDMRMGLSDQAIVEKMLSSPDFGERWGRHFMDIWRYCDWYGLGDQLRHSQRHIWHWRDWIIDSLNDDKGYDRMILEQLAADELMPTDRKQLRATGFLARSYYLFNRTTWLDETIEHTSRAFLGLTMQCVKCHDHKYDPIDHADYYKMRAVFEPLHVRLDPMPGVTDLSKDGLPRVFDLHLERKTYRHIRGDEKNEDQSRPIPPGVPAVLEFATFTPRAVQLPTGAVEPEKLPFVISDQLAAAKAEKGRLGQLHTHYIQSLAASRDDATMKKVTATALAAYELENARLKLAATSPSKDAKKSKAAEKAFEAALKKMLSPGTEPAPLKVSLKAQEGPDDAQNAIVQTYPEKSTGRRLALAQWIANEKNPLTARVLVNQVWMRLVGASFVPDVSDFGRRAPQPAQQAILDTLAVGFMENGWSIKWLIRNIALSDLYRLSSSNAGADAATMAADPDNLALWRMNPRRLESQAVRDALLALSGKLDRRIGGPSLDPGQSENLPRRSIYFTQTPDTEHRFLGAFDNANVLECYRRNESVVPQQALALSNSRLSREAAEALNAQWREQTTPEFIQNAFQRILGRIPSEAEQEVSAKALADTALSRASFLQALFNHNDFVTLR